MSVFTDVVDSTALGERFYARALCADPGPPEHRLRAGIHIGPLQIEDGDVGRTVNFAARVVGVIRGAEIWLSEQG